MNEVNEVPIVEITEKQLKFAELVASGKSYIESYKEAGYALSKNSPSRDRSKASEVARNPKVAKAIEEKRKENAEIGVWERQKTLEMLLEIAEEARLNTIIKDKDGKTKRYNSQAAGVALRAAEQASKMCGYNAPEEVKQDIRVEFSELLEEFSE